MFVFTTKPQPDTAWRFWPRSGTDLSPAPEVALKLTSVAEGRHALHTRINLDQTSGLRLVDQRRIVETHHDRLTSEAVVGGGDIGVRID